ncbi:MAG TPA: hypothetical protein VE574_04795 [Nitrososphaeraceae archaeon]|nr:hypothetical protein [Nitrososphaeraceae archaeon]
MTADFLATLQTELSLGSVHRLACSPEDENRSITETWNRPKWLPHYSLGIVALVREEA